MFAPFDRGKIGILTEPAHSNGQSFERVVIHRLVGKGQHPMFEPRRTDFGYQFAIERAGKIHAMDCCATGRSRSLDMQILSPRFVRNIPVAVCGRIGGGFFRASPDHFLCDGLFRLVFGVLVLVQFCNANDCFALGNIE